MGGKKPSSFHENSQANYISIYYVVAARNYVKMLEIQFYKCGCIVLIINCTEKLTSVRFII